MTRAAELAEKLTGYIEADFSIADAKVTRLAIAGAEHVIESAFAEVRREALEEALDCMVDTIRSLAASPAPEAMEPALARGNMGEWVLLKSGHWSREDDKGSVCICAGKLTDGTGFWCDGTFGFMDYGPYPTLEAAQRAADKRAARALGER